MPSRGVGKERSFRVLAERKGISRNDIAQRLHIKPELLTELVGDIGEDLKDQSQPMPRLRVAK